MKLIVAENNIKKKYFIKKEGRISALELNYLSILKSERTTV